MAEEKNRERLARIIDAFPHRRITVIGDLIADEFLYGRISRVSREAPVLVLEYHDLIRVPGGAGNAANNLLDLGCRVSVVGKIGRDEAGADLLRILAGKGADVSRVREADSYRTPVKTRILAGAHHSTRQQVVRIDRGECATGATLELQWAADAMRESDGIILSDYQYGAAAPESLEPIRGLAAQKKIPVVVDSRFRMAEFSGVTSMTPNITELEAAAGLSIGADAPLLHKVGQRVLRRQNLQSLLVTQGRFGMTLFERRRPPLHIPIFGTDDVADVTGAGDTVIAVFTLAMVCGASCSDAASLANFAGGIVVMKRGTATVNRIELQEAIRRDPPTAPDGDSTIP